MRSRRSRTWAIGVLIAWGAAAACGGRDAPVLAALPHAPALLQVANQNWADAKVYVLVGGTRQRVATVTSMGESGPVDLPRTALSGAGGLVLVVELIGSAARYISPRLDLFPGQTVELRIENNLRLTNFFIW